MKLLLVAATIQEIEGFLSASRLSPGNNILPGGEIHILITGVGMTATAFEMGGLLAVTSFDLAVNLGIAGSFDRDLAISENVWITADTFAELGAEDGAGFITIEELGFGKGTFSPLAASPPVWLSLPQVRAITMNTVHGDNRSIERVIRRLNPQVESMEGAAFFYCCESTALPSLQVRAISNYVEPRNKDNWQLSRAIKNLNTFAAELISLLGYRPERL